MLKNLTKNINVDIYLAAAEELGIKITTNDLENCYFTLTKNNMNLDMYYSRFSFNNSVAYAVAENKYTTNSILHKANLPVPKHKCFYSKNRFTDDKDLIPVKKYAQENFPIVLKPVNESLGTGVFINIKTLKGFNLALEKYFTKKRRKKILLEEYVKGADYRIVVANGKIIDVIKRHKPYVVGDGQHTLEELITNKNKKKIAARMPIIKKSENLKFYIKKQNLELGSVPQIGETVILNGGCNISLGGETERIDIDSVHNDNKEAFLKAVEISGLHLCGVDFISPNISKSYKEVPSVINELNSNPHPDVSYFADMEADLSTPKQILSSYFDT